MSFFNKIIDRAKHGKEDGKSHSVDHQSPSKENKPFGFHTPHSSASSNITSHEQQQSKEDTTTNNHYANGYVTPRPSQDLPQQMEMDTPGNFLNSCIYFYYYYLFIYI